ncbi:similar to transcription factor IIA large subunit [Cyanidioschyzon merolae strain 10D]|jgi:hypothetical protein|uniref:Similar to transcription factor IIA large subunit n=1 Tax=Cyanidioschyzon merolae (strain NIES-3377 / 10D) TaxID=280699 RepID=M1VE16_CYAM1|nr:similar to transcription factor IIA large subunit [Cyanidioschyzon merolae strain 10D]BAM78738.1 similar to transcription factor IIA large subunit [Cyanidioschyzon merolae strain 10D]|eukprot:XP_005535024.1 similar to transcription factor IIA large subunit [Cyanidioschyzon merolae strain 10D]
MNGTELRETLEDLIKEVVQASREALDTQGELNERNEAALRTLEAQWRQRLIEELHEQGSLRVVLCRTDLLVPGSGATGTTTTNRTDPLRYVYETLRQRDPRERRRSLPPERSSQSSELEDTGTDSGEALSSGDDDDEISQVAGQPEPETANYVLSQYERVLAPSTNKQRIWRVFLRDAMVHINGQDLLLNQLQCQFDW